MEQIIITHSDGSETPLFSRKNVSGISKATQKTALLSDDVVTVTVSSAVPLPVDIGDRIKVYGRTYTANQLPEPGKNGLRRYEYDMTFEGLQYGLIDAQYKLPPDAYGDTYYSDLYGHLRVLVWNANRVQPNKWRLGSCPAEGTTDYKNLTTSSRNCLQVLQDICSEWNVEFEITPGNGFNTINIKEKAGVTHAFTLRYGRGKGLYSLKRTNVNNAGLTTRLFVYGGQDNLGQNYGHTRLCLPNTDRLTSFLEDAKAIAQYGVKENEKVYDIKPERVGEVTAIGPDEITFSDTTAGDNAMFDLNAKKPDGSTRYLLDGVAAKIKFQTGQLAGYEFDVHKYDHATRTFILNRFTDENGMVFPSATSGAFQISKGDKYIITEIQLPESYITAAENKLAEAAKKDFPAMTQPQVSYKLTLSEDFLIKTFGQEVEAEIFHVGDYINVKDEELGINKAVRIVRIERNLLKRHTYEITLSDTVTKSTTVRVLNEIDDINDVININKLADPTRARRRWMATQELLNMVFDPEGDYYSEKIKPLSIETQMLSVGAKSTQFTLLNVTFQPNYNKDPNALYISGGRLAHYAIEENIRQWVLTTATYTNLKPATAYYIYARCSTAAGDGTIILSESAITVEQEAGYYNFLVGVLNSVVTDAGGKNPGRLVSLTYGSSTINGRFLRTGRIESSGGGKCYFDLDNDEIGGVIRFVGSDGNYYDIADVQDTADRKRQVFVAQPYGPYDVGDLWLRSWTDSTGVARKDLYRCVTARASGFNVNDWAEATFYDNTQVTIDRGIITAGTVQLANGNSQSIVAGITGGENEAANETEARKVRIWAGASKANRFTAPFRVLQDGSFVATKGTITGTINANSGTIGGFEIGSGRIGTASSSTASSGSGLSLYGDFIKFANTYCWASIGANVLPASVGMVGVGRFTNSTPNSWGTNYGLLISVTGATTNLAIKATGAIVSDSYIESYGLATITPSTNNCHIPGELTSPTMFRIKAKFIYDNAGIGFPSRGSIATALGIGSSTPFAVRFTIIVDSTSTKTGYITGRNTFVTGKSSAGATTYPMNSNSYPYRLNQNGGNETGKMNMAKGDTAEFMLVWDGSSNYYAYWLSHIS
ncbi:phage tail protein [Paramuribaculum intestinale]|uniref:phage tail protein n=2 Tax=Paramuribaculum intestinale TaxID=2094151 RepID=UPI0027421695|nr:phage tail protein [Paramuribaculum intestinale]WLT41621.1 phage tail protein [Paramuribaculum intestinale]